MTVTPVRPAHTAFWILIIVCLLAMIYVMVATSAIELGAAAHDAFCSEHGWAV